MLYLIIVFLTFLGTSSPAFAHGVIGVTERRNSFDVAFSINHEDKTSAQNDVLRQCDHQCDVLMRFENTCMGFARAAKGVYFTPTAQTEELARSKALAACQAAKRTNPAFVCQRNFAVCDRTPVPRPLFTQTEMTTLAQIVAVIAVGLIIFLLARSHRQRQNKPSTNSIEASQDQQLVSSAVPGPPPSPALDPAPPPVETISQAMIAPQDEHPVSSPVQAPPPLPALDPASPPVQGISQAPSPTSYDLPPGQPMALMLKRTQKPGFSGVIYMLDARIDVSADVRTLIAKHDLGSRVIYESSDRQKHAENVQAHLEGSRSQTSIFAPPSQQAMGAAKTFWKLGRAAVSAARAALALRVTVNSLLSGVHVECKGMDELLEAEDAIRQAKANLEGCIATAQTFDGREEIV